MPVWAEEEEEEESEGSRPNNLREEGSMRLREGEVEALGVPLLHKLPQEVEVEVEVGASSSQ